MNDDIFIRCVYLMSDTYYGRSILYSFMIYNKYRRTATDVRTAYTVQTLK